MKILFVSTRRAKPSYRFRVEHVLPFYKDSGHDCEVAFLPSSLWGRFSLYRRMRRFDVVVIQKRTLSRAELQCVRRNARRLVYDVDDAIMFDAAGAPQGKRQTRFRAMVRAADLTICGNAYLAEQTRQFTDQLTIIPTPIDAQKYRSAPAATGALCYTPQSRLAAPRRTTIGWTGSRATNRYLNDIFPVLAEFAGRIELKIISDVTDGLDFDALGDVPYTFIPWSPEIEITETATFDVGVMPLPDNPWTRGKCGFKALQYMSLSIPAVCSPVGVNSTIVAHGENGFLATTPGEWSRALTTLIDETACRDRLGLAARQRIEAAYSLDVLGPRFVAAVAQIPLADALSA